MIYFHGRKNNLMKKYGALKHIKKYRDFKITGNDCIVSVFVKEKVSSGTWVELEDYFYTEIDYQNLFHINRKGRQIKYL